MIQRVKSFIQSNQLIEKGDRVLVGVSGGPDSMALLHILRALSPALGCEIAVAHVNHMLRKEADQEEAFVKQFCEQWGIPCYSLRKDVGRMATEQKTSLEEMGRRVRYQFFYELAQELGAPRIATAHHRDDVAETVLLHLLRGSGLRGLRGILPMKGELIRPLLEISKRDILSYLEQKQIAYCLDESNICTAFARNRIRHELIPYLEASFNPRMIDNLNQLAFIVRGEDEIMETQAASLWEQVVLSEEPSRIVFDGIFFMNLPDGFKRRLVLLALSRLAESEGWSLLDVEKVLGLDTQKGSSKVLQLKKKIKVNRSYDKIIFSSSLFGTEAFAYPVPVPGEVYVVETGETFEFTLCSKADFEPCEGDCYLDFDRLCGGGSLNLRSRRNGDVFRPNGMQGSKKLKNYFIDQKVPYFERDQIALLVSEETGEIYAIPGFRVGQGAAVTPTTETILVIKKHEVVKNK